MKKLLKYLLCLVLSISILPSILPNNIYANDDIIQDENFNIEIEIGEPVYQKGISTYSTTKTVSNYKKYYYKNDKGETLWIATLTGTFEYNGSTSKCLSASVSVSNISSGWQVFSKKASTSGNQAKASVIMRYTPAMSLYPVNFTLSCSPTGSFY